MLQESGVVTELEYLLVDPQGTLYAKLYVSAKLSYQKRTI